VRIKGMRPIPEGRAKPIVRKKRRKKGWVNSVTERKRSSRKGFRRYPELEEKKKRGIKAGRPTFIQNKEKKDYEGKKKGKKEPPLEKLEKPAEKGGETSAESFSVRGEGKGPRWNAFPSHKNEQPNSTGKK